MGRVGAQQHAVGHRRLVELLPVGIQYDKRHALDILQIHVVDGVVTATANAHHLDDGAGIILILEARVLIQRGHDVLARLARALVVPTKIDSILVHIALFLF